MWWVLGWCFTFRSLRVKECQSPFWTVKWITVEVFWSTVLSRYYRRISWAAAVLIFYCYSLWFSVSTKHVLQGIMTHSSVYLMYITNFSTFNLLHWSRDTKLWAWIAFCLFSAEIKCTHNYLIELVCWLIAKMPDLNSWGTSSDLSCILSGLFMVLLSLISRLSDSCIEMNHDCFLSHSLHINSLGPFGLLVCPAHP